MQNRRTILAALAACSITPPATAQGALTRKRLMVGGRSIDYLVRYADGQGSVQAPMLLCFGGGDANEGIAQYYDAVYTPTGVYRDHHVVLPVGPEGDLFFRFDDGDARGMIAALQQAEPLAGRGLISGVSNGGRAAFRFAAAAPEAFRGFVTMPGAMVDRGIPAAWRDYAILLACGTRDPGWQIETDRAFAALSGKVGAVETLALEGQGHVVGPDYDIDPVYERLRAMETRLGR